MSAFLRGLTLQKQSAAAPTDAAPQQQLSPRRDHPACHRQTSHPVLHPGAVVGLHRSAGCRRCRHSGCPIQPQPRPCGHPAHDATTTTTPQPCPVDRSATSATRWTRRWCFCRAGTSCRSVAVGTTPSTDSPASTTATSERGCSWPMRAPGVHRSALPARGVSRPWARRSTRSCHSAHCFSGEGGGDRAGRGNRVEGRSECLYGRQRWDRVQQGSERHRSWNMAKLSTFVSLSLYCSFLHSTTCSTTSQPPHSTERRRRHHRRRHYCHSRLRRLSLHRHRRHSHQPVLSTASCTVRPTSPTTPHHAASAPG